MKRTISILLALSLLLAFPVFVSAVASPRFMYIISLTSGLSIDSAGKAACDGKVVHTGSNAKLTVTLQQYKNNEWVKYAEWDTTGKPSVTLGKSTTVASGYKYRVLVTATIYNAAGNVVETADCPSPEKSY